ncbi:MAG TPA: archease [Spirochaetota bacterium]|nr:archease [Spirochaetota bacterium]HPJ35110.1 archease [Spirochaetota bacterium]
MDYELIEDITFADVAVRVKGDTPEEVFIKGGSALLSEMVENRGEISPVVKKSGEIKGESLELLYFEFLNEILFFKDAEGLLLLPEKIRVTGSPGDYRCLFTLAGERIDMDRHRFRVDVKGVTMHGLKFYIENETYIAESVFDV